MNSPILAILGNYGLYEVLDANSIQQRVLLVSKSLLKLVSLFNFIYRLSHNHTNVQDRHLVLSDVWQHFHGDVEF